MFAPDLWFPHGVQPCGIKREPREKRGLFPQL